MNRALLLFGHPDTDSFNHQLAAAYERGFKNTGTQIERIDLASLRFDPILHKGYRVQQPLEPDLLRVKAAIERADHLVWVFPTHWAAPPTLVRGLVDRLFLPGWAFRYEKGKPLPVKLLTGKSARVITTMDSPGWWYSLVYQRPIHRAFGTATLSFSGIAPVRFTALYSVNTMLPPKREQACQRIERLAAADVTMTHRR